MAIANLVLLTELEILDFGQIAAFAYNTLIIYNIVW